MNATAAATETYFCACEREVIAPAGSGLPAGWEKRSVRMARHSKTEFAILCPDCCDAVDARERARSTPDDQRTHDSSSAIDDEPPSPIFATVPNGMRLWQVTLIFNTDKGAVESRFITAAQNPIAAIPIIEQIARFRRPEMVSLSVTPAPLGI